MAPNRYRWSRRGFSWTEVLVLVAVIAFLAAVLIPMMDRPRSGVKRSVAASNIRQIGQAALIYANDNREQLPGLSLNAIGEKGDGNETPGIHAIAAALARHGGLNDAQVWMLPEDQHRDIRRRTATTVLDVSRQGVSPEFYGPVSFQVVAGLTLDMPSVTPIAVTRGLQTDGKWAGNRQVSVFGGDGGHIVFLGGHVNFYRDLRGDNRLLGRDGSRTSNLLETIDVSSKVFSEPATGTASPSGTSGIGEKAP